MGKSWVIAENWGIYQTEYEDNELMVHFFGFKKPNNNLSKVDFPHPLAPIIQTNSPCCIEKEILSRTILVSSYEKLTLSAEIIVDISDV